MAAPSFESLSGMKEEEHINNQKQELPHSPGEGASSVMASSPPGATESNLFVLFYLSFLSLRIYLNKSNVL